MVQCVTIVWLVLRSTVVEVLNYAVECKIFEHNPRLLSSGSVIHTGSTKMLFFPSGV